MINYEGQWALITGASSGIGEAFARELAKRKMNVILVARRNEKLIDISRELINTFKVKVEIVALDLSRPESADQLYAQVNQLGHEIHMLINNAGFGVYGKLCDTELQKNQEMIFLNVFALASITHMFLPNMLRKREGAIINVASTGAFLPTPYFSNYGASKAYVLSFTEALWAECHDSGVHVLALCPGPVKSEFRDVSGAQGHLKGRQIEPGEVVNSALQALENNQSYLIPGPAENYWTAQLGRFLPRAAIAKLSEKVFRPKF